MRVARSLGCGWYRSSPLQVPVNLNGERRAFRDAGGTLPAAVLRTLTL